MTKLKRNTKTKFPLELTRKSKKSPLIQVPKETQIASHMSS